MSYQIVRENPWFKHEPLPESYLEKLLKEYTPAKRRQLLEGEWIVDIDPAVPGGDKTARATVRNGIVL